MIPRAFQGKSSAPQATRLNALLTIIALGWGAFCAQHVVNAKYYMAGIDALAVVLTLLVCQWAIRSGRAEALYTAAHLAMVISTVGIIGVSMLSGQDAAMASWYLTAVPLFSAYALGTREAVIWAGVASVAIVLIYLSPYIVSFEPEYIPNEQTWLVGKFVLLAVLLGLAVATRRATDANVDALAQRELIIRERARELSQARDEALAAVRAKDDFLANMSHEIRTPLNGIIGMTSVLLDAEQPDDQREMVKTIQRSSTALLAVLNEILDFSKLEADAVVLESIPFDLRECVEDAVDLLGRAAFEKGLEIYIRTAPDVPRWIEGDITYLRQVLLNLIGNAIKFTDEGEVHVDVTAPELDLLQFSIVDTGIGIAANKHEMLFRSFSQVDASTTRKYGGTGLGLAISKRLIELMGGKIWVESEVGAGSSFHFTIRAPAAEPPIRPMSTLERVTLIGHSVVLAGGSAGAHDALVSMLTLWGLKVTSVLDPAGLESEITRVKPEAVIAYENAAEPALALSVRPRLIFLVPLADAALRERTMSQGVEAVVFRPVRQRALRLALENVISGDHVHTPGPSFTAFDPSMAQRVPARILVGEDNPVNQRVAVTVLEKLGYSPDVASNGVEVLAAMKRRDYDILFLDLQMPDMDGLETTRHIREDGAATAPWIVALTASVGSEQRAAVRDAGMNDFVSKPFDVQTLMVAIERWAGESQALSSTKPELPHVLEDDSPWGQLQSLFARSPERLAELVGQHLENGQQLVDSIAESRTAGEFEDVALHAHSLKSSAAQFGSDRVSRIAAELERHARRNEPAAVAASLEELSDGWGEARTRLEAVINDLVGSVEP